MPAAPFFTFVIAITMATALPGATIAALIARVLGKGGGGAVPFCIGIILGDVIWFSLAVFGLSVLAQTAQPVFVAAKYAGAAYLLWLAWKLWSAPITQTATDRAQGEGLRLFLGGLSIAMGNPKTMMFYIALMPSFIDLTHLTGGAYVGFVVALVAIYSVVLVAYVIAAVRMRRVLRSTKAMRVANRTTGAVMAGSAVVIATR